MEDRLRFVKITELFEAVCDLPKEQHEQRLVELAPDDAVLRSEVLELLLAESRVEQDSGLSATSIQSGLAAALSSSEQEPSEFAGYRVLGRLGAGGMGVVYEAEQRSPRRRVALKLLRGGFVSRDLVRRFEFEVEALARLRHHGIAQIYEAGVSDLDAEPRPFFAMELVDGLPLDRWASSVSPRDRIAMVAEIADAVQHAHSRGVVHRDLKPANILVTGDGQPKVLDFGVARSAGPAGPEARVHTSAGQLIGTLPYMSPELVRGAPDEIDARVDVYALGVVLFEVLTGRYPLDVSGMGVGEAAHVIEHVAPKRLASLESRYGGDLDVIIRTALAKDKERRYATVSAFADDLRRYLGGQTISARPASAVYQLSRLARRHKPAVVGLGVAAAVVVASSAVTSVALVRERGTSERLQAENANVAAVNTFLSDMLTRANADEAGGDISLRDVLESAAAEVEAGSVATAEVEGVLRVTLGSTFGWLGHSDRAVELLEPALALNREVYGPLHERTLTNLHLLARFLAREGAAEQAIQLLGDTPSRLAERDEATRSEQELLGNLYRVQAIALKRAGRVDEVEDVLVKAAEVFEGLRLPDGRYETGALGEVQNELGTLRRRQGRLEESREHYLRSLEIYGQVHGEDSERYSTVLNNLAIVYRSEGDLDRAIELLQRSVAISEAIYGETSVGPVMVKLANLGNMHARVGHYAEAERVLRRAFAYHQQVLPAGHPNLAYPRTYLADVCAELGNGAEAVELAASAAETMRGRFGDDSPQALTALLVLGKASATDGDSAQARAAFDAALDAAAASYGRDSEDYQNAALTAAGAMLRSADVSASRDYLVSAGRIDDEFARTVNLVEGCLAFAAGEHDEAVEYLDAWWELVVGAERVRFSTEVLLASEVRVLLLSSIGRDGEAKETRSWLEGHMSRSFGDRDRKPQRLLSVAPSSTR